MKKYLLLFLIAFTACTPKVGPNTDPRAVTALKVKEVVIAIGTVQHTAIELNKVGIVNNEATEYTIDYVKSALNVIKATPNGWQPSVIKVLDELENKLNPDAKARLFPYLIIVRNLISRI